MDSSNSGTPSSKERIAAKAEREARRREDSERERSKVRKCGGQPGQPGKGPAKDPDPGEKREAPRPAECRKCQASRDGAAPAGQRWAQSYDNVYQSRRENILGRRDLAGSQCTATLTNCDHSGQGH